MSDARRPTWRRRMQTSRARPIAVQLVVPVALGLVIGGVLAFQAGSSNSGINQVPLGYPVSPTASANIPASMATTPATALLKPMRQL